MAEKAKGAVLPLVAGGLVGLANPDLSEAENVSSSYKSHEVSENNQHESLNVKFTVIDGNLLAFIGGKQVNFKEEGSNFSPEGNIVSIAVVEGERYKIVRDRVSMNIKSVDQEYEEEQKLSFTNSEQKDRSHHFSKEQHFEEEVLNTLAKALAEGKMPDFSDWEKDDVRKVFYKPFDILSGADEDKWLESLNKRIASYGDAKIIKGDYKEFKSQFRGQAMYLRLVLKTGKSIKFVVVPGPSPIRLDGEF